MLLTLYKDSKSSFLGALEEKAVAYQGEAHGAALMATGLTIDVPWSPETGQLLAHVLIRWRRAKPTRSVMLTFENNTLGELMKYSPAEVEWLLPTVKQISILDLAPPDP